MVTSLKLYRNRKHRQDLSLYASLVAAPDDLSGDLVLPGNATLYLSTDVELTDTTLMVEVGDREIGCKAAPAGFNHNIGHFERGMTVSLHADAVGTVTLYVQSLNGQLIAIASS